MRFHHYRRLYRDDIDRNTYYIIFLSTHYIVIIMWLRRRIGDVDVPTKHET